jgi:RimJ/RimL family protein N-acetyltransferase
VTRRVDPSLILDGRHVRLVPLAEAHLPALVRIVRSTPERFRYTYVPERPTADDPWAAHAFAGRRDGSQLPFAVLSRQEGTVLGTTRYSELALDQHRVEVGYTLLDPAVHGGPVNVDSKLALFGHAFDVWGVMRLQIQADARNTYSLAAIRALGMTYEGTLRRYGLAPDGGRRDAAMFSLLQDEWPEVRARLEARRQRKERDAES